MASRIERTHPLVAAPVRTGPWPEPLAITGLGMATSLGGAFQACAAARASMSRPTTLDDELWDPEGAELVPAVGCPVPSARGFSGVGRSATLAAEALADLFGREPPQPERTGFFVAIGSGWHFDARDERAAEQDAEESRVDPNRERQPSSEAEQYTAALARGLLPALRRIAAFPAARAQVFAGDGPGFVTALDAARAALASGHVDRCLVGGVDSYVEADHLEAFRVLGILKGPEAPTGILPGEGAAFVQVETVSSARRRGARALALMSGIGIGLTDDTREEGFVQAIGAALVGSRTGVGLVVTDLDGSTDRAAGWGMALVRSHAVRDAAEWIPAMSFGSVGAAAGPLDERDLIQQTGYNLNDGFNLIILPREPTPAAALMLPRHPDNHLKYTEDVKKVATKIKGDVTRGREDHKLDKTSAANLRTELENWERVQFWKLVKYGKDEAEAGRPPPTPDGAPMAPVSRG